MALRSENCQAGHSQSQVIALNLPVPAQSEPCEDIVSDITITRTTVLLASIVGLNLSDGPACTDLLQPGVTLTPALRVLVQDQLLHPVHRLLPRQGRPHQHLHLLLLGLGGPAAGEAGLRPTLALASEQRTSRMFQFLSN